MSLTLWLLVGLFYWIGNLFVWALCVASARAECVMEREAQRVGPHHVWPE